MDIQQVPTYSRDIIIAAIESSKINMGKVRSPEALADSIIRALADKDLHVVKAAGLSDAAFWRRAGETAERQRQRTIE